MNRDSQSADGSSAEQRSLPFEMAQASHDERRNKLGVALKLVEADLYLAQFALLTFNLTRGGTEGELTRTYEQLAATPWGLCCSISKARSTVRLARRQGIVEVLEHCEWDGTQQANGYKIDWEGVDRIVKSNLFWGVSRRHPPVSTEHPPVSTEHPPVSTEHRYKEQHTVTAPVNTQTGTGNSKRPLSDEEELEIIEGVPTLLEAWPRTVQAWPCAELLEGPFRRSDQELKNCAQMVIWFRRQLSLPNRPALGRYGPITGDTEAHLLLTLAAASHVQRIKGDDVRSRWALFSWFLTNRVWADVLHRVSAARSALDELVDQHGRDVVLELPPEPKPEASRV